MIFKCPKSLVMTQSLTYWGKKCSILTILILKRLRRIEDRLKTIKFVRKDECLKFPFQSLCDIQLWLVPYFYLLFSYTSFTRYINKNIIVLPLIYDSQSEIETICLKLMKNASFDVTNCRPVKLQKTSKKRITLQFFFIFLRDTLETLSLAMKKINYVPWDCRQRLKTIRIHFRYIRNRLQYRH